MKAVVCRIMFLLINIVFLTEYACAMHKEFSPIDTLIRAIGDCNIAEMKRSIAPKIINEVDNLYHNTPLAEALTILRPFDMTIKMVTLLLEHNADPNKELWYHPSQPIELVAGSLHLSDSESHALIKLLLDHGAVPIYRKTVCWTNEIYWKVGDIVGYASALRLKKIATAQLLSQSAAECQKRDHRS